MKASFLRVFSRALIALSATPFLVGQIKSSSDGGASVSISVANNPAAVSSGSQLTLHAISTMNVASELGGAFMNGTKCDSDGNLYIRKFASDRPLLGPVVKIDVDGKRTALFDAAAFAQLDLDRVDSFSPAPDGGLYQIAQSGVLKRRIFVLHFSSDGTAASPTRLDADLEVYTFAAFADGNFLVSGVERDPQNKKDQGKNFTAVFSADGRELAPLSFEKRTKAGGKGTAAVSAEGENPPLKMDLAEAEVGSDGNLYVMRASSPALVYVIAPTGEIVKTLKIAGPTAGAMPSAFHVSGNQMALLFWSEEHQTVVVADAQTGRKIATYVDLSGGSAFACFSANEGVFTFLRLGEANELEVIRAAAQ